MTRFDEYAGFALAAFSGNASGEEHAVPQNHVTGQRVNPLEQRDQAIDRIYEPVRHIIEGRLRGTQRPSDQPNYAGLFFDENLSDADMRAIRHAIQERLAIDNVTSSVDIRGGNVEISGYANMIELQGDDSAPAAPHLLLQELRRLADPGTDQAAGHDYRYGDIRTGMRPQLSLPTEVAPRVNGVAPLP